MFQEQFLGFTGNKYNQLQHHVWRPWLMIVPQSGVFYLCSATKGVGSFDHVPLPITWLKEIILVLEHGFCFLTTQSPQTVFLHGNQLPLSVPQVPLVMGTRSWEDYQADMVGENKGTF